MASDRAREAPVAEPPPSTGAADDFLARAQALGLRLSRTDYERTRAGVAAFLKAERLPSGGSPALDASTDEAKRGTERVTSPLDNDHDTPAAPQLSRWLRTTSGQLSFFTAVVNPMSADIGEPKTRLSLDEVGSAEERRRRRNRRRRLLVKQMMLECGADAPSIAPLPASQPEAPTPRDRSPAPCQRSSTPLGSPRTPRRASTSWSDDGADDSDALVPGGEPTPRRASSPTTPDLHVLNRLARVNAGGKLWLAPREQDDTLELSSEDACASADDSGVSPSHHVPGWGPRSHSRAPPDHLDAHMKNMSLLDRVMLTKSSPRRARREARLREQSRREGGASSTPTSTAPPAPVDTALEDLSHDSLTHMYWNDNARASDMASWADVSTDALGPPSYTLSAPDAARATSSPPSRLLPAHTPVTTSTPAAPAAPGAYQHASSARPSGSHSRQPSASMRWLSNIRTPRRAGPSHDAAPDMSPLATITPMSRYDPGTQITPMRYSPGFEYDGSRAASTSLAFSPNLLTPWTQQGRLMSNAGLAHVPSSPMAVGDWTMPSSSASASTSRRGGAPLSYSSTPLSHLPSRDPDASGSMAMPTSSSRLLCIESFPGRSPPSRDLHESPTRPPRHSPAGLRHARHPSSTSPTLAPRSFHASPWKRSASVASTTPATVGSMVRVATMPGPMATSAAPCTDPAVLPMLWSASPSSDARPFRRTDTIRPSDIFGDAAATAEGAPGLGMSPRQSLSPPTLGAASPRRRHESDGAVGAAAPPDSHAAGLASLAPAPPSPGLGQPSADARSKASASRLRLQRRKSAVSARPCTPTAPATPMRGDDVFAPDTSEFASFKEAFRSSLALVDPSQMAWDQPDGSRIVKLVSEELQAALDSGALEQEPEPRYFRLPPGHGSSKAKPSSVSYAGLIGQAILSSSDGRLSLAEIYQWISSVYPYYERRDRGWQNSIRHNLSLNKSFVKLERDANVPGKGGWWAIEAGHEHRFQHGLYLPNGGAARADSAAPARAFHRTPSAPARVMTVPVDERRKKRTPLGDESFSYEEESSVASANTSFKRPKTLHSLRFVNRPLGDEQLSSPVVSSPMYKAEADSFDTSTSRSMVATPSSGAPLAPPAVGTRLSPSMAVARAQPMLDMSALPPHAYTRTMAPPMHDYGGMMYMKDDASRPTDYAVPMASSPKRIAHAPMAHPPAPMPGPMAYSHLQAHVPMVPAAYPSYPAGAPMAAPWPDAHAALDLSADRPRF